MAVLDSEELLQQAELRVKPRQPGLPRQVDVRRAISVAYYALFHCIVTTVADEFVGRVNRTSKRYSLVYRNVDHGKIRSLCGSLPGASGDALREFGAAVIELQGRRHTADYDPEKLFRTLDVVFAVSRARQALSAFDRITGEERVLFLKRLAFLSRE